MTYIDLEPDVQMMLVDGEHTTIEELEAEKQEYEKFCLSLNQEWPPDRVKSFLLNEYRDRCQRCLEKEKELEIENKDERRMGKSYAQRRAYSERIKGIRQLFNEYRETGVRVKKGRFQATDFITPVDMAIINVRGFEQTLRCAII